MNIEKILDELIEKKEKDLNNFIKAYANLPLHIYESIESLSFSKTKKDSGTKAKIITKAFHDNFTTNN